MFPFRVQIKPGAPVYEQVIYAVQKAILKGQLKPGSRFPSVRQLSQELRINPNTAHKIVTHLTAEGLLDVQPGIERLVVEAKGLSITLSEITRALEQHWEKYHE
jgi:GntR family transcriptional regulator